MRALVVAGTHSGVGKTSVSLGLMGALTRRGLRVAPFKVGPDFIDPAHHAAACRRPGGNLDGWMLEREVNLALAARRARGCDVAVVEGVMGCFDGYDGTGEAGSTAEMAKWLGAPVLLVLDAWALSRSAAAIVLGFQRYDPDLDLAGVVLNRVASPDHERWLREAIAPLGVPVLGALPRAQAVALDERHLGLRMAGEAGAGEAHRAALADLVEGHLDLDEVLGVAGRARWPDAVPRTADGAGTPPRARVGVARDEAFCFVYEDALDALRDAGAQLVEYSPLRDPLPDDLDGLYLPGGYPELYAAALAANTAALDGVRALHARGAPIWAECGGLMYCAQGIEHEGARHELAGLLATWTQTTPRVHLAYCEARCRRVSWLPEGMELRGHRFHFSECAGDPSAPAAFAVTVSGGGAPADDGYAVGSAVMSWLHMHPASNPGFAPAFVDACARVAA